MGHLSTSERVDATKVAATNASSSSSNGNLHCDHLPSSTSTVDDNEKDFAKNDPPVYGYFSDNDNFSSKTTDEQNDQNNNSDVKLVHKKTLTDNNTNTNILTENQILEFTADHRNKTDLNQYTTGFRDDSIFGIKFKAPLKWDKIIQISALHIAFVYTFFTYNFDDHNYKTTIWSFITGGLSGIGVTGGAHRLWTHRSYKANAILRSILMCCFSLAGQNTLFDWVRDHRVHHKYSETDGDPHNANRGFFFAHVGWLMMHKHPEVIKRGRQIDMTDVLNDPVVQFHQKYFIPLKIALCFVIPTIIPVYFWGETWYYSAVQQCIFRYVLSLNFTWSVNSAAHLWGYRPFDKRINPAENRIVSVIAMGEGWHNYHHVFPWDYKAAELGNYGMNLTTMWLDIFAKLGWAWDMKQPSNDLIRRTAEKYGDGTHPIYGHSSKENHNHNHNHHHMEEVPIPNDSDTTNLIIHHKKAE